MPAKAAAGRKGGGRGGTTVGSSDKFRFDLRYPGFAICIEPILSVEILQDTQRSVQVRSAVRALESPEAPTGHHREGEKLDVVRVASARHYVGDTPTATARDAR